MQSFCGETDFVHSRNEFV